MVTKLVQKDEYTGGNSLVVQWLGLQASNEGGMVLIPGQRTQIPQGMQLGQREREG